MAWNVPDWLTPLSPMQERSMKLAEEQVAIKGVSLLRKQIGLARMQDQARRLTANGVDELTARKQALLENAQLIFTDEPEAYARLMQQEEVNDIRQRTNDILQQKADELNDYRLRSLEEKEETRIARQAKDEADLEIKMLREERLGEQGDRGLDIRQQNADTARARADERARHNREIEQVTRDREIRLSKPAADRVARMPLPEQMKLRDLYAQLKEVRKEIAGADGDDYAELQLRRARIEREIRAFAGDFEPTRKVERVQSDETGSDDDAEPAQAAPKVVKGQIVRQGGKRYRFEGGDPSDPKNYTELP